MHLVVSWTFLLFSGWVGGLLGPAVQRSNSIPCVPAAQGDTRPWEHNTRVLRSFPPDTPAPRFLGRFSHANQEFELHLWRDSQGVFGQWLSPVLDADSPTSRLYDARFDPKSGSLTFASRIPGSEVRFVGKLQDRKLRGTLEERSGRRVTITLTRAPDGPLGQALREGVTSRAQFECQMILFRRH